MTLIAGIDPGASGAVAVYCTETSRIISAEDLPFFYKTSGRTKKKRIDAVALDAMFDALEFIGVEHMIVEEVGGLPRQSANGAFAFGFIAGLIYMCMIKQKVAVHTVPARAWKGMMSVPGKSKGSADDILARADELFPKDRALFRGARGGRLIDRAEAAMLAKFCGDFIVPKMDTTHEFTYTKPNMGT